MTKTITVEIDKFRLNVRSLSTEIVRRQYILQPEFEKYGEKGVLQSIEDANYNLEYLLSSIESDSKILFEQYNIWVNNLFTNLRLPIDTLYNFYIISKKVLEEEKELGKIDKDFYDILIDYIDTGLYSLKNATNEQISFFREDNPIVKYLEKYYGYIFSGNKEKALELISYISSNGTAVRDIYKYIFQPFLLEIGRLWHENKISVAQEHYATAVSQMAMATLYNKIFSTPKNGKVLLGTCIQGELHEFGIRMVCDYLESCGWNTYYLGANMPERAIIQSIKELKPDIIAISCTMTFNVPKVKSLIQTIKNFTLEIPIIVGGYPFNLDNQLWKKIGADGYSENFEDTVNIVEKCMWGA